MGNEKKKELTLPFVNDGKPFSLEDWNVKKHKEVLKILAKEEEKNPKLTEEQKDDIFKDHLILKGLEHVDDSVKLKDLETMHPLDKQALFLAIYYSGRKGITVKDAEDGNFRKKK